jgi:hypothetical protein
MAELFEQMGDLGRFSWCDQQIHMLPLANIHHFSKCFVADLTHSRPRDYHDNYGSHSHSFREGNDSVIVVAPWTKFVSCL